MAAVAGMRPRDDSGDRPRAGKAVPGGGVGGGTSGDTSHHVGI